MTNTFLIPTSSTEEREQKVLKTVIRKKRGQLIRLTARYESLKMELDLVKYDYDIRIGKLYLKDNQLDLEIIQYKNIQRLMHEGLTYEEAVKQVEDTYYSEQIRMDKEQEKLDEEQQIIDDRQNIPEEEEKNIKMLWKKLIAKYHPDLVTNIKEKERREQIMKKINKAYAENDYDGLKLFESALYSESAEKTDVEDLEAVIIEIEKSIIKVEKDIDELRHSQWFSMKIRLDQARKKGIDIFKDLEKSLLDDIVKKIDIVKKLRQELGITSYF